MLTKHCSKCNTSKPVDEFYKDRSTQDGLQGRCKECCLASNKAWSDKNREKCSAYTAAARIKFPEKNRARDVLNKAVSSGKLIKSGECSRCSSDGRIEGHHEDYTKPLEVIWLCPTCHGLIHRAYS